MFSQTSTSVFTDAHDNITGGLWSSKLSLYSDINEKTHPPHYTQPLSFPLLHQQLIAQGSSSKHERIVTIDRTFIPKSGKKTEGTGLFYNSSHGKSEQGLEWCVLSIVDLKQNTAYTLNAIQTIETPSSSGQESRTQQYLKQVQDHRDALPADIKYLVGNGY